MSPKLLSFFPERVPDNFCVFRNCIETDFRRKSLIQFVRLLNSPILGNCHSSPFRKMSSAICFCSHRKRLRSFFSITFCSGREVKGLFENDSKRSSKSSKCRQRRRRRRRSSKKVTLSSFFPGFTSLSNFFVGSS